MEFGFLQQLLFSFISYSSHPKLVVYKLEKDRQVWSWAITSGVPGEAFTPVPGKKNSPVWKVLYEEIGEFLSFQKPVKRSGKKDEHLWLELSHCQLCLYYQLQL